jgi:hypothetical protein
MVKIIPAKTGLYEKTENKLRWRYSFIEGVEIEIDERVKNDVQAKGFIKKPTKKTKINKEN